MRLCISNVHHISGDNISGGISNNINNFLNNNNFNKYFRNNEENKDI
jgi:glucokinase